jgi:hypothetical protein
MLDQNNYLCVKKYIKLNLLFKVMSSWSNKIKHKKPNIPTHIIDIFMPTFHILIATAGRPCLRHMLDSLKDELLENDAITIIFDGENAFNTSTLNDEWLNDHKSKINIIKQSPNLGFYGHAIRNKYQGILTPKTTFIMNADDDDYYVTGTFNKLRRMCFHSNRLYIAKFYKKNDNTVIPSNLNQIIKDDIGTPCGIIPFNIANKSTWELKYGGDFDYYNNLKKYTPIIEFLDLIIYIV